MLLIRVARDSFKCRTISATWRRSLCFFFSIQLLSTTFPINYWLSFFLSFIAWLLLPTHSRCREFLWHPISLSDTHSLDGTFPRRGISPSQRPLPNNTQHSQEKDIRDCGEIRTHNSKQWNDVCMSLHYLLVFQNFDAVWLERLLTPLKEQHSRSEYITQQTDGQTNK